MTDAARVMLGDVECRIMHGTQSRNRTTRFSARIARVPNVRALLACVCCAITMALAAPAETTDKARELRELRERIEKLQRDLVKSEESRSEAADALSASEKSISEANRNLAMLGREQARISQSLAELKRAADEAKADAARQQDLLGRLIRHQYMYGNTDGLRLLLDGQDVGEVERRMRYLGYVSRMRADLIVRQKKSAANLAELESTTRLQQQELTANADAQRKARAALQTERHVRQKLFARIKGDITKGRREIGRLKRDEDRLGKLVEQLAKAIARNRDQRRSDGKAEGKYSSVPKKGELIEHVADASLAGNIFEALKGRLKLPVRGELQGRFGSPREDGGVTWKGLFIKAENGHAVHAVADGQVVYADWLRGFGNLLIVDHGGGYMSLYGNNESLLKHVGDATQSGETVASVGSSGGAPESGVYFELRHEGKPFDPMRWVGK